MTAAGEADAHDLPGLDAAGVTAFLAAHLASPPPYTFELIAAGGSNLTFRVTASDGAAWALRRPPAGPRLATAHDVDREQRILAALASSEVPVPAIVAVCADDAVTGAPFYVMEFVDGLILRTAADGAALPAAQAAAASTSLVDTQIAFHTVDLEAVGLSGLGRHDDYVGRQLKRWRIQVESGAVRDVSRLLALHDALVAAKPDGRVPAGLAHGDYRFDNTIIDAGTGAIVAVLDWELCTIGDPIADMVWSAQYWADPGEPITFLADPPTLAPHFPRRADIIETYRKRSGFPDRAFADLDYLTVFSWWKQACIVEGVYARRTGGSRSGAGGTTDPGYIADRAERLADHAHELAATVLPTA